MIDLDEAEGLLLYGDTERNSDLFYATRFHAPDPFFFVCTAQTSRLLINDLEFDRACAQADVDEVLSLVQYNERAAAGDLDPQQGRYAGLGLMLRELELRTVRVAEDFPVSAADYLRASGFDLTVVPTPVLAQRATKSAAEVGSIRSALKASEAAMDVAIGAIRDATVGEGGQLFLDNEVLTSERVRFLIHRSLLEMECTAQHTIVACGEQGCDPHEQGHGPLRERLPIIIDIFPRSATSGYFGDITRTVAKGQPTDNLRRQFDAVLDAQQGALESIRGGADGRQVHNAVAELFASRGFETGKQQGRFQGFFHGTGHGLGLDIHEAPSISARGGILEAGHVVTVEPGLYYLGEGGVRIEDVVLVNDDGCENLTTYAKFLEV
jgi:Xaa-Pro aminopeptidase